MLDVFLAQGFVRLTICTTDIRAAPLYKGAVHTTFLKEYLRTLEMSTALFAFTCTQSILIPQSLRVLQDHPNLRYIRVGPKLTSQDDCRILRRLDHLESLSLDAATWSVIDALPDWIQLMTATLTALTLYVSHFRLLWCSLLSHPFSVADRPERHGPEVYIVFSSKSDEVACCELWEDPTRPRYSPDSSYPQTPESGIHFLGILQSLCIISHS